VIPEIGHFLLVAVWVVVLCQGILPLMGASRSGSGAFALMSLAKTLAYLQLALISLALAALIVSFLKNDFTVAYVANHSDVYSTWFLSFFNCKEIVFHSYSWWWKYFQ